MDTKKLHSLFTSSSGVSIDSRKISNDQIFFSLKGENFDGNKFALEAIKNGAKFSIVDSEEYKNINDQIIYVKDCLKALQDLSNYHRSLFDTKLIGVTGSNGKTTTKNLIYSVLNQKYKVIKTVGNLNNHIGVPISLLNIKEDVDIAIIEMGANHVGEIETLCKIAMPDIGLITNYGLAHLEGFGGFKGVIKGKTEMFDYLSQNYGHIILNNDDVLQVENCKGDLAITFGENVDSEFVFNYKKVNDVLQIENEGFKYKCNIYGDYNFSNIATSITIGKFLEMSNYDIQLGLDSFENDSNRSQIIKYATNKIYLDAYNANPTSMKAAILNFENSIKENKILVLGDMFELGSFSNREHQDIINYIENKDYIKVYLVGVNFYECITSKKNFEKYRSTKDMSNTVRLKDFKSMNILIKGSRVIGLEALISV